MKKEDKVPFPEVETTNLVLFKENITKSEIQNKAASTIESVNEGHVDSISVYTQVRAIKEVADAVLKGIMPTVVDDVERLQTGEREYRGIRLDLSHGRTTYDFSHDDEWNNLQEQMQEIKDKVKAREKLMIDAIRYDGITDKDTGEVVEPAKVSGGTSKAVRVVIPK
jgi:hypothetical protein